MLLCALKQLAGVDLLAALKNAKRVILSEEEEKQPELSPKYQTVFWSSSWGSIFQTVGHQCVKWAVKSISG